MVVSNPAGVTKLPTKMGEVPIELVVIIVCVPVFGITNKLSETGTVDVVGPSKNSINPLLIPFIPCEPVEPCAPITPWNPCRPVEPCAPVAPVEPCAPVEPVTPWKPCAPVVPVNPWNP